MAKDFRDFKGDKTILLNCKFMDRNERSELKKLIIRSKKMKHKSLSYISILFKGKQIRRGRAIIQVAFNCILPQDIHIHHINGKIQDDRVVNLAVLRDYEHISLHHAGKRGRNMISISNGKFVKHYIMFNSDKALARSLI